MKKENRILILILLLIISTCYSYNILKQYDWLTWNIWKFSIIYIRDWDWDKNYYKEMVEHESSHIIYYNLRQKDRENIISNLRTNYVSCYNNITPLIFDDNNINYNDYKIWDEYFSYWISYCNLKFDDLIK